MFVAVVFSVLLIIDDEEEGVLNMQAMNLSTEVVLKYTEGILHHNVISLHRGGAGNLPTEGLELPTGQL